MTACGPGSLGNPVCMVASLRPGSSSRLDRADEDDQSGATEFDQYAANYESALAAGLSISGESSQYFAHGRIRWLTGCLRELNVSPRSALDFGCGTGSAAPYLAELLNVDSIIGLDVSTKSLAAATQKHGSPRTHFHRLDDYQPCEAIDLAFCNGVFHHVPVGERAAAVRYVYRALRPGGLFAFWENNPLNPGTRYVMSRIPFDRDAVTLRATEARQMLRTGGFEILRTDFLFIFPKMLGWLRWVEPSLAKLPLGAQYQVLCRKA